MAGRTKSTKEKLQEADKTLKLEESRLEKLKETIKKKRQERNELLAAYTTEILQKRDVDIFEMEDYLELSVKAMNNSDIDENENPNSSRFGEGE